MKVKTSHHKKEQYNKKYLLTIKESLDIKLTETIEIIRLLNIFLHKLEEDS